MILNLANYKFMISKGTLIFFCGKMGAGKTTLSHEMAESIGAVRLSEDEWLEALFPYEIGRFDDYLKYSARLKPLLKPLVRKILNSGVSVVMDFPANTINQRAWFKEIFSNDDIPHKLIYLEASDQICLSQIKSRRIEQPERAKFDTEVVFNKVTSYFEPPSQKEGFNIEIVSRQSA